MRKIHAIWGAAAGVFVLAGVILCALGLRHGVLLVKTDHDPSRTVGEFFGALAADEPETAYGCLSNYTTLGLENVPRTEDGALLLAALRDNRRCTLLGAAQRHGDTARQSIRLRFLDLDALETSILSGQFADIPSALDDAEALCGEAELTVTLRFDGESWKIVMDRALLDAIQGHTPEEGAA